MTEKFTVTIDNGKVHLAFSGYEGEACYKERERIIEALKKRGVEVVIEDEEPTSGGMINVSETEHVQNLNRQ